MMPDVPRLGNVISEVLLHQNRLTIDDIETLGGLLHTDTIDGIDDFA